MGNFKHLANVEICLALVGWSIGLGSIITGQTAVLRFLYFFAWYPYVAFLDGLLFHLRGESWLHDQPRNFFKMFFWSVTIWLIFEAFNLALKNWGYIEVIPVGWTRWGGYALAFATVLPGVLLTAQVLEALGAFKESRGRPFHLGTWQPASMLAGTALLVMPLILPRYAFPLIWVALIFLLDPFCDLLGAPSLLVRWAQGERRQHFCLLAAGLICGLWWESWNWFAITKWVYIFPVYNFAKLFEMPILGYVGFLPFALECAVMYNFMKVLDERVFTTSKRRFWAYATQVAFWLLIFAAMDACTVISFQ